MRFTEGFRKGFQEGQGNSSPLHTYSTTTPLLVVVQIQDQTAVCTAPALRAIGLGR